MTYNSPVTFIETCSFTKLIPTYLNDDEYRELQTYLIMFPDAGCVIRGSGGIRKLRWSQSGTGKSGGVRTIYYWAKNRYQIYMLTIYSKSEQQNIDAKTLKQISQHLEQIK